MKLLAVLLVVAGLLSGQKKPQLKPPQFTMLETSARREGGLILLDGRLKNVGERAAHGVAIYFDFLDPDRKVLTTKQGELEEDPVDALEEAEFHVQMEQPARVTHVRLRFEDKNGRDIKAKNTGPFAIE